MAGGIVVNGVTPLLTRAQDSLVVVMDVQQKLAAVMPNGIREQLIERVNVLLTTANTFTVGPVNTDLSIEVSFTALP